MIFTTTYYCSTLFIYCYYFTTHNLILSFHNSLIATCVGGWKEIEPILEISIKGNYRKVVKLIKQHLPDLYDDLGLNYYNPWCSQTYRSKDGRYIIITHSMIEYLFETDLT